MTNPGEPTRLLIIEDLRKHGCSTATEISTRIGFSYNGTRHQVSKLIEDGRVKCTRPLIRAKFGQNPLPALYEAAV